LGEPETESVTWEPDSGVLGGLRTGTSYQLELWNLFNCNQLPESINLIADDESMNINIQDIVGDPNGLHYLELRKEGQHIRSLGWWTGLKDKYGYFPEGVNIDLVNNLIENEPLEVFKENLSSHPHALSDWILGRAVSALADNQPLPPWLDQNLLRNKLDLWLNPERPTDECPTSPNDHRTKEQAIKITLQIEPIPFFHWTPKARREASKKFINSFKSARQSMGIPPDEIRIEDFDGIIWAIVKNATFRDDLKEILKTVGQKNNIKIKQGEEGARQRPLVFHVKLSPVEDNHFARKAQSQAFLEVMTRCRKKMNISPDSIRLTINTKTALPVITVRNKDLKEKLDKMREDAEMELSLDIALIRKRE
jgi:hypothetical protein